MIGGEEQDGDGPIFVTDLGSDIEVMGPGAGGYMRKPVDPRRFLTRAKAGLRRARG